MRVHATKNIFPRHASWYYDVVGMKCFSAFHCLINIISFFFSFIVQSSRYHINYPIDVNCSDDKQKLCILKLEEKFWASQTNKYWWSSSGKSNRVETTVRSNNTKTFWTANKLLKKRNVPSELLILYRVKNYYFICAFMRLILCTYVSSYVRRDEQIVHRIILFYPLSFYVNLQVLLITIKTNSELVIKVSWHTLPIRQSN